MNILIAEDSSPMRRMIRRVVAKANDEVYECADGTEAVAVYIRFQPDWVLMDIEMPKMDGIAATRAIYAFNQAAKIIVVTNYDDPQLREEARAAGATAFVVKDDLSRLRRLITN